MFRLFVLFHFFFTHCFYILLLVFLCLKFAHIFKIFVFKFAFSFDSVFIYDECVVCVCSQCLERYFYANFQEDYGFLPLGHFKYIYILLCYNNDFFLFLHIYIYVYIYIYMSYHLLL